MICIVNKSRVITDTRKSYTNTFNADLEGYARGDGGIFLFIEICYEWHLAFNKPAEDIVSDQNYHETSEITEFDDGHAHKY